jgi:prepilin-type N-terminal cleavage/methylation domain-containing protein
MKCASLNHSRPNTRRGMTMVEVTISSVIVAVLFVAALRTVAAARQGQKILSDRARAEQLAVDLVNEILAQSYMTTDAVDVFGLEPGKSGANRSQFTDVDDYNNWSESPLQDRNGNALSGTTGWTRSASVAWADATTWAPTAQANTGLKLITVTVSRKGAKLTTLKAYRSVAWVDTIPTPTDATSNHTPTAAVTASRTTNRTTLTTTLDASTSSDPDGDALSYVWNFGDGTSGNGVSVTHTYNVIGTYNATVTIYDGHGGAASAAVVLSVTP